MIDLKQYKDILGKPGEGIHFHVFGIAIVDVVATILLGCLLGYLFSINPFWFILGLFILAEFLHYIFGVETTVMKLIKKIIP